jgi:hypothetical protein
MTTSCHLYITVYDNIGKWGTASSGLIGEPPLSVTKWFIVDLLEYDDKCSEHWQHTS